MKCIKLHNPQGYLNLRNMHLGTMCNHDNPDARLTQEPVTTDDMMIRR
jgi:hypothetical protein